jgi:hypothetical protein
MKSVDVTPTWLGLLPMLLELTRPSINQDARQMAFKELARMAEAADKWNEHVTAQNHASVIKL